MLFCYQDRQTLIPTLFACRGPPNVPWLIVSIHVDSIQAVLARWSWAYVFVELEKAILPALTHGDPSAPVVLVFDAPLIEATLLDVPPACMFWTLGQPVKLGMLAPLFYAATGGCLAAPQSVAVGYGLVSTLTFAVVANVPPLGVLRSTQHSE